MHYLSRNVCDEFQQHVAFSETSERPLDTVASFSSESATKRRGGCGRSAPSTNDVGIRRSVRRHDHRISIASTLRTGAETASNTGGSTLFESADSPWFALPLCPAEEKLVDAENEVNEKRRHFLIRKAVGNGDESF